jgi:colanic acid/amylovoran biosynthesis glycosyltransferase
MSTPPTTRVAYLVSQYPALSHAFIETEVATLREMGAEVRTFSVRPSSPAELLTERARHDDATTTVLLESPVPQAVRALAAVLRRSPRALGTAVRAAMTNGPGTVRARVWQLFYLGEALVLWRHMSRDGLRHVHVHFANNGADVARLAVAVGEAVDGPTAGWGWSLSMHGPTEFEDQTAYDLAAKVASARATACISDFCRSQVMRLLPPEQWSRLSVVRMAVDATRFAPAPVEADGGDPAGPLRVLTVGRLVPEKGAPVLLEAVARLVAAGVPVQLTVVGAGELAGRLAADARRLGIDDVVDLAGPVGQDRLPDLYRAADVFCLPSFAEGLPVVLMEAMATGLPVVTTTIAGIPELVVDHQTGLLVPPGRADLLADALEELATDRGLRRRLGSRARAAVLAQHDRERNAGRLLALFPTRSTD